MTEKAKFAVCLIFWFELHARWLDWCQIENLIMGEIPTSLGSVSAVLAQYGGIKKMLDILDFCFLFAEGVCPCLLSICNFTEFPFNF